MDSRHVTERLDGYLDGEFDLAAGLEIERHLQGCPACRAAYEQRQALSRRIRAQAPRHAPPAHLSTAVLAGLRRADGEAAPRRRFGPVQWLAAAAALLLVVGLSSTVTYWLTRPGAEGRIADEVADSHAVALHGDSARLDIATAGAQGVGPWFHGKLDFAPPVTDWSQRGYPLLGGRIDQVAGRRVAVLVYRHGAHVVSLYMWPASQAMAREHRTARRDGVNLLWWREGNLQYWLASDLDAADLLSFHHAIEGAATGSSAGAGSG